jgi:DNA polymerase-3 subunit delta
MRIVVLHGPETLLMREWTQAFEACLESAHGGVARFSLDGATATIADVLDEVRSFGLMQDHKLVILDNADKFLADKSSDDDDDGGGPGRGRLRPRAALERYAEAPVDSSSLLLRATTWHRGKLDKLVAKVGVIAKCDSPSPAAAVTWCGNRCRTVHGTTIAGDAARLLVERIGPELGRLDTELAKLATMAGAAPIDRATVLEMVGLSREDKAWVIQAAILSGDPRQAVHTIRELLEVSRSPEALVMWAIVDLLRKLHDASRLLAAGRAEGAVAKTLRLWGDSMAVVRVARRLEPARWAQLLQQAIATDVRTKTGLAKPARSLEGLALVVADTIG